MVGGYYVVKISTLKGRRLILEKGKSPGNEVEPPGTKRYF